MYIMIMIDDHDHHVLAVFAYDLNMAAVEITLRTAPKLEVCRCHSA